MSKSMYVDCKTCGTKFDWVLSQEEPQCTRCQVLYGNNPRAILDIMSEHKVPGQRELFHVIGLILNRLDVLEGRLKAQQAHEDRQPPKGMTL